MVIGLGNDLVEISRMEQVLQKEKAFSKMFTEREIEQGKGNPSFFAGNFAVKESVSKVFGTGFRGFGLRDIEVLRNELGKPYVNLYGGAKELAEKMGVKSILVSITNTKELVMAVAVAEGEI